MEESALIDEFLSKTQQIYNLTARQIKADTRLKEDLNSTAMQFIEMVRAITELTGKKISINKISKCITMGEVIDILESLSRTQ